MVALGVTISGPVLYFGGRFLVLQIELLHLSYPFLALASGPVLLFLVSVGGFFLTIAMLGLIFSVLLGTGPQGDVLVVGLLGSIATGFRASACYVAINLLVNNVE